MSKSVKISIVVVLIAVVGAVIALKQQGKNNISEPAAAPSIDTQSAATTFNLPRMVDLGAGKCIRAK